MDEVERAFRDGHGQAVATLTRLLGDLGLAEDAVQEAFAVAARRWPTDGVPDNPLAWIITTSRNRAIDTVRRSRRGRELYGEIAATLRTAAEPAASTVGDDPLPDDQLRLIFTCCHPALRVEHQVALTLRLVAGLTPAQVAAAFLVSEETMAKRLVRAKHKVRAAHIPFRVPRAEDLPRRVCAVLAVVYLVYNAGTDDLEDLHDLRGEALWLARLLSQLLSDEPEVSGLLALLLLNESRMPARQGSGGVLLREQDRSRWDQSLIAEGQELVLACLRRRRLGPYQLQAAIQALHCAASSYDATDWPAIVRFYDRLLDVMPTPVVAMNRAIAVAETEGPHAGLTLLAPLQGDLEQHHVFHAARGALLERLDRRVEAADAYARAAERARLDTDIIFLAGRRDDLAKTSS